MNIDTYYRDDKYEVPGINITDRDDTDLILMIWVGDINDAMCTNLVFLFADFADYTDRVASLQVCSDQYSNNDTLK